MGTRFLLKDSNFIGLNTKSNEVGLPFGYFAEFDNIRTNEKSISRRKGLKRLVSSDCVGTAVSLDPTLDSSSDSYIRIPLNTDIHKLGTQFTLDITIQGNEWAAATDPTYAHILGFEDGPQPFSLFISNLDGVYQIVFRLIDENGTVWQLVSTDAFDLSPSSDNIIPIRIVRDGAKLEMRIPTAVENTVQCSINCLNPNVPCVTPTHDLIIGSIGSGTTPDATLFTGIVDEFRIFSSVMDGFRYCFNSFPDIRYPSLNAYYRFNNQGSNTAPSSLMIDDSRYGNHGEIQGSAEFVTGLIKELNAIEGITQYRLNDDTKIILFGVGETLYSSKIG